MNSMHEPIKASEEAPSMTAPVISTSFHADHITIRYRGPVCDDGADELQDVIRLSLDYYQYRRLDLFLESPGGSVTAMRRIVEGIRKVRRMNVDVRTSCGKFACSAAAVMLSFGDWGHRKVKPHSHLLYHRAGYQAAAPRRITESDASEMRAQLKHIDASLADTILETPLNTLGSEGLRTEVLRRSMWLRANWSEVNDSLVRAGGSLSKVSARVPSWVEPVPLHRTGKKWMDAYRVALNNMLAKDIPVSTLHAWTWCLIDEIEDVVRPDYLAELDTESPLDQSVQQCSTVA